MEEQGYKDRRDEHLGMRRAHRNGMSHGEKKGYNSKTAAAGHAYNESRKHREAESMGMKRYYRDK